MASIHPFSAQNINPWSRRAVPVADEVKRLSGDGLNKGKLRVLTEIFMNPEDVLEVPEKLGCTHPSGNSSPAGGEGKQHRCAISV